MKKEMFDELLESIEQAGEIKKGNAQATRSFKIEEPDVVATREKYKTNTSKHKQ